MKNLIQLWNDEHGFVISSELILLVTLIVIGLIGGLSTVRDQLTGELTDLADAVSEFNASYSFAGISGHGGSVAGTAFLDEEDFCEDPGNIDDQAPNVGSDFGTCTNVVAAVTE